MADPRSSGIGPLPNKFRGMFVYSVGVCRKAEDAYPTGVPGPCSQFKWNPNCSFTFVTLKDILVTLCSLLCLCIFHVWSLSLNYILLITARILFPWISLSCKIWPKMKNIYIYSETLLWIFFLQNLRIISGS